MTGSETMENMLGNRYQIIKKIGDGGMAVVYLAKDTFLDRLVAVKVLREEFSGEKNFTIQFHHEAKAIAGLIDLNIVNIYDYGVNDGRSFIVMEYVDGQTLKEIIAENAPLSTEQVAEIGKQICSGIAKAHSKGVVHKDIKPQNILIDATGTVKVMDFGIAQSKQTEDIAYEKGILGSAHYFSPEQARGETIDHRTDIYSIGVVLYEMCTGRLPYTGDSPVTVALKHLQSEPLLPSKINPAVSIELERVILKAMAKNPVDRYSSTEEMKLALERILHGNHDKLNYTGYIYKNNSSKENSNTVLQEKESFHNTPRKPKKKLNKKKFAAILSSIAILLLSAFVASSILLTKEDIIVPDLTNMNVLEAQKTLINQGLSMDIANNIYHDTIAEGAIIKQSPSAGNRVKEGRTITVTVSLGVSKVKVPDLSGLTEREAKIVLEQVNLTLGKTSTGYSGDFAENTIIFQSPKSETEIEQNTPVDIILSLGSEPKQIAMPKLLGLSINDARQRLLTNGLTEGTITYAESYDYNEGEVIWQSVETNTTLLQGTKIDLSISMGPGTSAKYKTLVRFSVPHSGNIYLELHDDSGSHMIYYGQARQGQIFEKEISYKAKVKESATLDIYCNDRLIDTEILP